MFDLDLDRAGELYGNTWVKSAAWYRRHSLRVVADPDLVLSNLNHPAVDQKIAAEFQAGTRQRAEMFEALSYGDAGFLLTTPGPSLSGVLVDTLGDEDQREYFRNVVSAERCRTFFAVTEPTRGSDAAHLDSRYLKGVLSGEKMLVGNGASGTLGTAITRAGDGPLDTVAVLLTPELVNSGAVSRRPLAMGALHGAQLSYLNFDQLRVPESLVLGRHLKAAERGLMGMMKTFHRFRPSVAAMAIGHAQAVVDYTRRHFPRLAGLRTLLDRFDHDLTQVRHLNLAAADDVDRDALRGALVSMAKHRATETAERVATTLSRELPASAMLEHPWLAKSIADTFAFEFMEGTGPIQLSNVYHGFLRHEIGSRP